MVPFLLLIIGVRCDDKDYPSDYYKGKIVLLNKGDGCSNIIEIQQSIKDGLSVGSTISFNPSSYNKQLKLDDIIYFKIIRYQKMEKQVSTCMKSAMYGAIIEFYNE